MSCHWIPERRDQHLPFHFPSSGSCNWWQSPDSSSILRFCVLTAEFFVKFLYKFVLTEKRGFCFNLRALFFFSFRMSIFVGIINKLWRICKHLDCLKIWEGPCKPPGAIFIDNNGFWTRSEWKYRWNLLLTVQLLKNTGVNEQLAPHDRSALLPLKLQEVEEP